MIIDGNQKEIDAMAKFHKGNRAEGFRIQAEFVAEFRSAYQNKDHCPCKAACPYHGDCRSCVAIHRAHMEHVPTCLRPTLNQKILALSELTEHSVLDQLQSLRAQ